MAKIKGRKIYVFSGGKGASQQQIDELKQYVDDTIEGAGAVAGVPCQIQSITDITGGHRVTFLWVDNAGTSHTSTMDVMDGTNGQDGADGQDGQDGATPVCTITDITGGHRVTFTTDGVEESFDVMDGKNAQFSTLPEPSASNVGQIVQYVGATTSGLTNGYFYQCKEESGTYSWVQKNVQTGGGGGTSDYDELTNKPQIAGTTLTGNKSLSDLGIASETDLENKVDKVTGKGLSENDYTDADKAIVDGVSTALEGKVDKVTGKGLSTNDYDDTAKTAVDALGTASTKDSTTFINPNNHDLPDSNSVYQAMTSMLEGAFHPSGSKTVAELTSALLTQANVGNIYKITDSGVTDANWVGGAGQTITANQMAVVVYGNTDDSFLFNLENGISIDMSAYQTKAITPISVDGHTKNNVEDAVDAINVLAGSNKTAIGNIKDGQSIDSFGDVETALGDKQNKTLTTSVESATTVEGALGALSTNKAAQAEVNDIVNVLGAKNLFDGSIDTTVAKGVTFTQNADGTISVTGSNTQGSGIGIFAKSVQRLKAGSYILSGCPSPTSGGLHIQLSDSDLNVLVAEAYDGNEASFTLNADTNCKIMYWGSGDLSITGTLVIKPMIRLATDPDTTFVPYSMTNQQMTPYVQAISNPNLLDNPWFTVNQRGFTSGTMDGKYFVDRWSFPSTDASITFTKNTSGINISGTVSGEKNLMDQKIEYDRLMCSVGDDYTLSVKFSDGTVKYKTDKIKAFTSEWSYHILFDVDSLRFMFCSNGANPTEMGVWVKCPSATTLNKTIRAIKLEKGCVSTLAMDCPPDYATELLKCQRYFYRIIGNQYFGIGIGAGIYNNRVDTIVYLPTEMRVLPTVTFDGTFGLYGVPASIPLDNSCSLVNKMANSLTLKFNDDTNQAIIDGRAYKVMFNSSNSHIDISADL